MVAILFMNYGDYAELRALLYVAAAKRRIEKARMAESHGSSDMTLAESKGAMKDLLRAAYTLSQRELFDPIDLSNYPLYVEDLKMAFAEMEFFELVRELCLHFSQREAEDSSEGDLELGKLLRLLSLIEVEAGRSTGFRVETY